LLIGVTLTVGLPDAAVAEFVASNVDVPPIVSLPENSSPRIDIAVKPEPPVNVAVKVTLAVLGDIPQNTLATAVAGHVVKLEI